MKRTNQIRYYAVVFAVGILAGRYLVAGRLGGDVVGVVLQVTGILTAVATSFLALGIRLLDSEPPREYSRHYMEQFRRKMDYHRRIFWVRYGMTLAASTIAAVIGSMLKIEHQAVDINWIIGLGIGSGFLALVVTVTTIVGYISINRVIREVGRDAEDMRRRNEFLGI